jgi:hypothetical protein
MDTGRLRGNGRAKAPVSGYMALDRSRRRRILRALILGRPVEPADEPFARDKASQVSSRLPHALFMSVVSALWSPTTVATSSR